MNNLYFFLYIIVRFKKPFKIQERDFGYLGPVSRNVFIPPCLQVQSIETCGQPARAALQDDATVRRDAGVDPGPGDRPQVYCVRSLHQRGLPSPLWRIQGCVV